MKSKYKRHFNNNKGRNGNFKERYWQYAIYCKGDGNKYNKAFKALVLDTNDVDINNSNSKQRSKGSKSCYFILFGTLTVDKAISISVELANKAYTYLLTINPVEFTTELNPIETNPFSYNITATALRYTLTVFMGIMINTSTLKKFIASYRQF